MEIGNKEIERARSRLSRAWQGASGASGGEWQMDRDELVQALESGDSEIYNTLEGGQIELNERGVKLCEEHGIRVDVDAYACAYAPDHLIRYQD